jgi:hypothetical protein
MLKVQEYLRGGKTHQDLRDELGIRAVRHDNLPLVILNYDQIDSPKTHPVVRECRGLVLHADTHDLVARAFARFFNWGEVLDEARLFDFSSFTAHTKEDGSLVLLFHFAGAWRVTTRGSFAQEKLRHADFTWQEVILQALEISSLAELEGRLDPSLCYVGELCSPYNTVVRCYPDAVLYLLSAFRGERELDPAEVDRLAPGLFARPARHPFTGIDQVQAFLREQASADPTFEGVVIRDGHGRRWKVKSPTYLGLHHLSIGQEEVSPKHLLPFILAGEDAELLTYCPHVEETYLACKEKVQSAYQRLAEVWEAHWRIEGQKEFAQAVAGQTPFTALLFGLRKAHGKAQTRDLLRQAWLDSPEMILRVLFRA